MKIARINHIITKIICNKKVTYMSNPQSSSSGISNPPASPESETVSERNFIYISHRMPPIPPKKPELNRNNFPATGTVAEVTSTIERHLSNYGTSNKKDSLSAPKLFPPPSRNFEEKNQHLHKEINKCNQISPETESNLKSDKIKEYDISEESWSSRTSNNNPKDVVRNYICNPPISELPPVPSRLLPKYLENIKQFQSDSEASSHNENDSPENNLFNFSNGAKDVERNYICNPLISEPPPVPSRLLPKYLENIKQFQSEELSEPTSHNENVSTDNNLINFSNDEKDVERNYVYNSPISELPPVPSRLLPKYIEGIQQFRSEPSPELTDHNQDELSQVNHNSYLNIKVFEKFENPANFTKNPQFEEFKSSISNPVEVLCQPRPMIPRPTRPPPPPPKRISTKATTNYENSVDSFLHFQNFKEFSRSFSVDAVNVESPVLEKPPTPPPKDYLIDQYQDQSQHSTTKIPVLTQLEKPMKIDTFGEDLVSPSKHYQNLKKESIFDGTSNETLKSESSSSLNPSSNVDKINTQFRESDSFLQIKENAGLNYFNSLPQLRGRGDTANYISTKQNSEKPASFSELKLKIPPVETTISSKGNKLKIPDHLEKLISQSLYKSQEKSHNTFSNQSPRREKSTVPKIAVCPKNVEDILYDYTYDEIVEEKLDPTLRRRVQNSKLGHLITELIGSEESYIAALEKVIHVYKPYLEQRLNRGRNLHELQLIFGNIEDIYEESKELLQNLKIQPDLNGIAAAYCAKQCLFELYPLYAKNKPNSDIYYDKYKEIIKIKQRELGDPLDLASYLLSPIQRPGKQLMLLENIQKELEKTNESCQHINSAINMIKGEMRKGEDLLAAGLIMNSPRDLISQTSYIMKEEFEMIKPKKKRVVVFLFKNVLVLTNPLENSEKCEYFSHIYLERLRVPPSTKDPQQLLLDDYMLLKEERSKKLSYALKAKTVKSKETWTKILNNNLWEQMVQAKAGKMQTLMKQPHQEISNEETNNY